MKAGRRRAAPRLIPLPLMIVCAVAGVAGLFLGGLPGHLATGLALVLGVAWLIQHFRRAAWVVRNAPTGGQR